MQTKTLTLSDRESRRIRFAVAELRSSAPGLSVAPIWLALLTILAASPLLDTLARYRVHYFPLLTALVLFAWTMGGTIGGALAWVYIRSWYTRRFGCVLSATAAPGKLSSLTVWAVFLAGLFVVGTFVGETVGIVRLPFQPVLLLLAFANALDYFASGRVRPHLVAISLLMAIASFGVPFGVSGMPRTEMTTLFVCVERIGRAVGDHVLLVRILHPLPEEPREDSIS